MKLRKRRVFYLTLTAIRIPVFCLMVESLWVTLIAHRTPWLHHIAVPDSALTFVGSAIGVLLAFRTSAAYARWWEARTLYGSLTNSTRSMLRQILASRISARKDIFARCATMLLLAFLRSLNAQLQKQDPRPLLTDLQVAEYQLNESNIAASILVQLGALCQEAIRHGAVDQFHGMRLDATLSELSNAQGGLERIATTPMPRPFDLFPQFFVYVYAALTPLALIDEVAFMTPILAIIVSCAFLVVNEIGTNLEAPFTNNPYRVQSDEITERLETFIRAEEMRNTPSFLEPTLA